MEYIDERIPIIEFRKSLEALSDRSITLSDERIHMKIVVKRDVSELSYFVQEDGSSGSFQGPLLSLGRPARQLDLNYSDNFYKGWMRIQQDSVDAIWKNSWVWPPSIDTFHMIRSLSGWLPIVAKKPRTVLDMGCGTGFLAHWIAKKFRSIDTIHLTDIIPTALILAAVSTGVNFPEGNINFLPHLGASLAPDSRWFINQKPDQVDILVSNPPYLPLSPEQMSFGDAHVSVSGLNLLEDIIEHGPNVATIVVLNFSEVCRPEIDEMLIRHGRRLEPVDSGKDNGALVQFRIDWLNDRPEMLASLVSDPRRRIEMHDDLLFHRVGCWRVIATEDDI